MQEVRGEVVRWMGGGRGMWSRGGGDAARYGDLRKAATRRALRMRLAAQDSHVRGSMGLSCPVLSDGFDPTCMYVSGLAVPLAGMRRIHARPHMRSA